MKTRSVAAFWPILLCTLAIILVGCGQAPTTSGSTSGEPTSTTNDNDDTKDSDSATMADYLHEHYASFDTFDEGIKSDSSIPQSLRLTVTDKTDGFVYDKETIVDVWNQLCAIRIDLKNPTNDHVSGEVIAFDFDSGKEVIPFAFLTEKYASFSTDDLYPVLNPQEVLALVDRVTEQVEKNAPKAGDTLVEHNGAYFWDADGDKMLEHMWLDFNNNGDEASSGYTVRLFNAKYDVDAYLNDTYGIKSVVLQEDEKGPYVVITTDNGHHSVRLVADKLVID